MYGQNFPDVHTCARQDMAVDLHDFGLWCADAACLIFICGPTDYVLRRTFEIIQRFGRGVSERRNSI